MVLGCKDWVARLFSSETIRLFRLVQPWLTMDFGQAGSRAGSDRLNWNLNSTSATLHNVQFVKYDVTVSFMARYTPLKKCYQARKLGRLDSVMVLRLIICCSSAWQPT